MTLKRLANFYEEETDERLRRVCEPHGVRVYLKVRLADIVPIERSGITDFEYSYALRAHVDFLVVDADYQPLFAVEFDGPGHQEELQQTRDDLKNQIAKRFVLPLLRVDARYLEPRYCDMDLLSWLVGVVLIRRRSSAMYEAGELTLEEASVDPTFTAPFVLSYPARKRLGELAEAGEVDRHPPFVIGNDSMGNAYGLGAVWLRSGDLAVAAANLPFQGFRRLAEDLLEELLFIKLVQTAEAVLAGKHDTWPFSAFHSEVVEFIRKYECHRSFLIEPRTGQINRIV